MKTKGRGALSNQQGRFESWARDQVDDGWYREEGEDGLKTELIVDTSKTVITRNQSPDVPFDRSINPYRGCEHGCVYCYARPTHAYLGFSPGLDFESKLVYKPNAARLLRREITAPSYRCAPIGLGTNTDPYQPVDRHLGITRAILEVLAEYRHPVTLVTKGALIERDIDMLQQLAAHGCVQVFISVTTLDKHLARRLEPRAAAPRRRLQVLEQLSAAGIPSGVLVAPVIPMLNDAELETLLAAVKDAGAAYAGYVLLRLPLEVKDLFYEWLDRHYPDKAERIRHRIQDCRGGRDYDPRPGKRMGGEGVFAQLIRQRFDLASKKLGFRVPPALNTGAFSRDKQLSLF